MTRVFFKKVDFLSQPYLKKTLLRIKVPLSVSFLLLRSPTCPSFFGEIGLFATKTFEIWVEELKPVLFLESFLCRFVIVLATIGVTGGEVTFRGASVVGGGISMPVVRGGVAVGIVASYFTSLVSYAVQCLLHSACITFRYFNI